MGSPSPREVIEACVETHGRDFTRDETYYGCRCGFKRTNVVGEGTYRRHLTDSVLAALSSAGWTIGKYQAVGWAKRDHGLPFEVMGGRQYQYLRTRGLIEECVEVFVRVDTQEPGGSV